MMIILCIGLCLEQEQSQHDPICMEGGRNKKWVHFMILTLAIDDSHEQRGGDGGFGFDTFFYVLYLPRRVQPPTTWAKP